MLSFGLSDPPRSPHPVVCFLMSDPPRSPHPVVCFFLSNPPRSPHPVFRNALLFTVLSKFGYAMFGAKFQQVVEHNYAKNNAPNGVTHKNKADVC